MMLVPSRTYKLEFCLSLHDILNFGIFQNKTFHFKIAFFSEKLFKFTEQQLNKPSTLAQSNKTFSYVSTKSLLWFSAVFPSITALPLCSAQCGIFFLLAGLTTSPSKSFPGPTLSKNQQDTWQPKQSCSQPPHDCLLSPCYPDHSCDPTGTFPFQQQKEGESGMPGWGRGRKKGWRKQFLDQNPSPRAGGGGWRGLSSLTAVEVLGGQGDDGASVQVPRGLAGGGGLDAALLRVFLQQLRQPHQVTVAKQSVGVQPPAKARTKLLVSDCRRLIRDTGGELHPGVKDHSAVLPRFWS